MIKIQLLKIISVGLLMSAAPSAYAHDHGRLDDDHEILQDAEIKATRHQADKNSQEISETNNRINGINIEIDRKYSKLEGKIKKLRGRTDAGVAGAAAIGSLAFDSLKSNSLAGGFGIAKDKVAGAIGYQHNFNGNWRARGTVSVSDKYIEGGGSLGVSW